MTANLNAIVELTKEQFYQLCQQNSDLRLERNAQGEIIIMTYRGRNRKTKLYNSCATLAVE